MVAKNPFCIKAMMIPSRFLRCIAALVCGCAASEPPPAPSVRFVDATAAAGIDFVHTSGRSGRKYGVETIGSGAAFFDYNRDGWMDLYAVNGADLPGYVSAVRPQNALYRNDGGRFAEVGASLGVADTSYGMGASAGDYDNDGDADLFAVNFGRNRLYRNEGSARGWAFADVTTVVGIGAAERWSTGSSFVDYDLDGDLDLYVANYLHYEFERGELSAGGTLRWPRRHLAPTEYPGAQNELWRNDGDRFVDVTAAAGLLTREGRELGVAFVDYDLDGDPDLFQGNDATPNFLWRNDGGRFAEVGLVAGVAYNAGGKPEGTMGVDVADRDGDGLLDLAMTNFQWESNTLYHNAGGGMFADESLAAGIAANSLDKLAFGINFLDADNDGDPDLYVANGHIDEDINRFDPQATYGQSDQLYLNDGEGRFVDASAAVGVAAPTRDLVGRGSAVADYDNDGDLDIFLVNTGQRALLWRNDTQAGHYLALALEGRASNRDGYGARVAVRVGGRTLVAEKRGAASYLSQNDERMFFGLGTSEQADQVEIAWPSGVRQVLTDVRAGQVLRVVEPDAREPQAVADAAPASVGSPRREAEELEQFWREAPLVLPEKTRAPLPPMAPLSELRAAAEAQPEVAAVHIELAAAFGRERAYDEAEAHYRRALQIDAGAAQAYVGLGRLYADRGALKQAVAALRQAVALDSTLAEPHYLLGNIHLRQQRLAAAVPLYERAIALSPRYLQAYFNLAGLHARQTDYGPAIAVLRRGLAAHPEAVELMLQLARIHFAQAQYEDALAQLAGVVQAQPARAEAHELTAQIWMAREDAAAARAALQQGLEYAPNSTALLGRLGILLLQENLDAEAIPLLQRALEADPDRAEVYYHLGQALLRRGEHGRGRQLLDYFRALQQEHQTLLAHKTAVVLNPNDADAYYKLGAVYARIGRYEAARQAYQAALTVAPGHLDARNNLGNIYLRRRALGRAIAAYQEVLRRDPHYARAHYNLGNAYLLAGEKALAKAAFARAVEADPEHRKARQMLAELQQAQGEH